MNGHNITYLTGSESFIGVYGATLIVKGSGVITNDTDSGLNVYGKETKDDSFVSKLIVEKDVTLKGKYGLAIFYDNDKGSHGVTVDFYGNIISSFRIFFRKDNSSVEWISSCKLIRRFFRNTFYQNLLNLTNLFFVRQQRVSTLKCNYFC